MTRKKQLTGLSFILIFLAACSIIKVRLDKSGLEDISKMILADFQVESPAKLAAYDDRFNLLDDQTSCPLSDIIVQPLDKWSLDKNLIEEKISFPSIIRKANGDPDTAYFYLYRKGSLKGRRVILWVPGFGVSDFAFHFIKKFFLNELAAGYDILFYNIPYHLDRIEEGKEMGEGLFTGSNINNLENVRGALYEIRTAVAYLKCRGVDSISGWGGSIGAAFLWLASSRIHFDHLTLMIPIVDWNTIMFNPYLASVIERMKQNGISEDLLRKTYDLISPYRIPTLTNPDRIQILYAKLDQLTPEARTLSFAEKWGITRIHGYEESHASILIDGDIYEDNRKFLKSLQPLDDRP